MVAAVLYAELSADAKIDDLDVLAQVKAVSDALRQLGYTPVPVTISLDMKKSIARLSELHPTLVFNLVENIDGIGRFIYFAPALLDHLGVPYTGAGTQAMYISTNKLLTKKQLYSAGLPTPAWLEDHQFSPPYIIKPLWEDASVGIDEGAVVLDKKNLETVLRERTRLYGDCFVEAFVPGREFNLSILAGENEPQVLPIAEIAFYNYPDDKARIVDYRAKWDLESFEYRNTVRTFDIPHQDAELVDEMRKIALACWQLFDCHGYARVDFRVDATGKPWVLEINMNPCISPDAGFVAAAKQAGLTFVQMVERIIHDMNKRIIA